jgi:hypothetical protein
MSQEDATKHIGTYLESMQSVAQNLADSISSSVNSQDLDTIKAKTQLLIQLIDAQRPYRETSSIDAKIEGMHTEMDRMHDDMAEIDKKLTSFLKKGNFWARMIPLFLVIAAIVAYPFYGMVTHMAPQSLVQYLSPVSGLAGAIIGYWFGRQGEGL